MSFPSFEYRRKVGSFLSFRIFTIRARAHIPHFPCLLSADFGISHLVWNFIRCRQRFPSFVCMRDKSIKIVFETVLNLLELPEKK